MVKEILMRFDSKHLQFSRCTNFLKHPVRYSTFLFFFHFFKGTFKRCRSYTRRAVRTRTPRNNHSLENLRVFAFEKYFPPVRFNYRARTGLCKNVSATWLISIIREQREQERTGASCLDFEFEFFQTPENLSRTSVVGSGSSLNCGTFLVQFSRLVAASRGRVR